jgi:hypothetical protein
MSVEPHTITSRDAFQVDSDGTFRISIGDVTLVFEIFAQGALGPHWVHLRSPQQVTLSVSEVSGPSGGGGSGSFLGSYSGHNRWAGLTPLGRLGGQPSSGVRDVEQERDYNKDVIWKSSGE